MSLWLWWLKEGSNVQTCLSDYPSWKSSRKYGPFSHHYHWLLCTAQVQQWAVCNKGQWSGGALSGQYRGCHTLLINSYNKSHLLFPDSAESYGFDSSNSHIKYTMYPWSLQANLFMGGQCTFVIDHCNALTVLRSVPGVLHNVLGVLRNVRCVLCNVLSLLRNAPGVLRMVCRWQYWLNMILTHCTWF